MAITYQLLADFSGTQFGGSPTWTDVTADLITESPGSPVQYTDGRNDESSDVNPAQCSFTLLNVNGQYTPGLASGAHYPFVKAGVRFRLSATVGGTTVPMFDGFANSFVASRGADDRLAVCAVACTDVSGRLGRSTPMFGALSDYTIYTQPNLYVAMTDDSSATAPTAQVQASGVNVGMASKNGGGSLFAFGGAGVPSQPSGSMALSPAGASKGAWLHAAGAFPVGTGTWTAAVWVNVPVSTVTGTVLTVVTAFQAVWTVVLAAGVLRLKLDATGYSSAVSAGTSLPVNDGRWHLVVVSWDSVAGQVNLAVDGASVTSVTTASGFAVGIREVRVGAGHPVAADGWNLCPASFGHLATWSGVPNVASLWNWGQFGFTGQTTSQAIASLMLLRGLAFGSNLTGSPSGKVGAYDSAGVGLWQALLDFAHVEGTPLYMDGLSQVTLLPRSVLAGLTSPIVLDGSAGVIGQDLANTADDAHLLNDYTVTGSSGTGQRAINALSLLTFGTFSDDLSAPFATDDDACYAAQWAVGVRSDSREAPSVLSFDVLALSVSNPALAAQVLAARTMTLLTFQNLPSPFASNAAFVQGRSITISNDECGVSVYATSAQVPPVLVSDTAEITDSAYAAAWG